MTVETQDYQFHILKYAINKYIDDILPHNSQEALNAIVYQSDEIVLRVATATYTKLGHQLDFLYIKNLLDLRIEVLTSKIHKEQRIKTEQEAQIILQAVQAKLQKEKEEAERVKLIREKEEAEKRELQIFRENNPNIDINAKQLRLFKRIGNVWRTVFIGEDIEINFDSYISDYLDKSSYDTESKFELLEELKEELSEEFKIEIPDDLLAEEYCPAISPIYGLFSSNKDINYNSSVSYNDLSIKEIIDFISKETN